MPTTYTLRCARKQYACTETNYHTIRPGDVYLYASAPPWHEANGGRKWWVIRACLRCAETYGLHNSDTREQLKQLEATK